MASVTQPQMHLVMTPAQTARPAAIAVTAVSGQPTEGDQDSGSQPTQPSSSHMYWCHQDSGDIWQLLWHLRYLWPNQVEPTMALTAPITLETDGIRQCNLSSSAVNSLVPTVSGYMKLPSVSMIVSTAQQDSTSTALPSTSLGLQWGSVHQSGNPLAPQQDLGFHVMQQQWQDNNVYVVQPPHFVDQQITAQEHSVSQPHRQH